MSKEKLSSVFLSIGTILIIVGFFGFTFGSFYAIKVKSFAIVGIMFFIFFMGIVVMQIGALLKTNISSKQSVQSFISNNKVDSSFKICSYCGKKYDASLDECPSCGATKDE
ncbi:MAG: hypothetical protein IJX26_01850 [Clostridia bacterium]|nr:hypothetical protein [Clostridia bacterium]